MDRILVFFPLYTCVTYRQNICVKEATIWSKYIEDRDEVEQTDRQTNSNFINIDN